VSPHSPVRVRVQADLEEDVVQLFVVARVHAARTQHGVVRLCREAGDALLGNESVAERSSVRESGLWARLIANDVRRLLTDRDAAGALPSLLGRWRVSMSLAQARGPTSF
jgi:hypothetical protein